MPHRAITRGQLGRAGEAPDRARQIAVGLRVARDPPERRDDAIEPQLEEGRQRRALRSRDLEHDDAAARPHDAGHLAQPGIEVGEVARAEADGRGVELGRREGSASALPDRRTHRGGGGLLARDLEHPLGEVGRRSPRRRARRARRARTRGPRSRSRRRARGRRATPPRDRRLAAATVVHAGGHHRVHAVVQPRDPIEHRSDLRLFEDPRSTESTVAPAAQPPATGARRGS